jgi:hypothetical protein
MLLMSDRDHWPVADNSDISAAEDRKKPLSRMGKAGHPVVCAADLSRAKKLDRSPRGEPALGRR